MPLEDTRKLAFSYVRFSSEKQRQGASLERQTEAAQRWADENGQVDHAGTFHGRHHKDRETGLR